MALLEKLFPKRRRNHAGHQENVGDRLFSFSQNQVRVVLFRECDFRGRKLLFDSQAVQKVSLSKPESDPQHRDAPKETYVETCNGHGYTFTKPHSDIKQLGEMIFGSVAMSYRGTSYKIHSLNSPHRLMYTQVFPSPKGSRRFIREHGRSNGTNRSPEFSLNDSGASSFNSAEQLSLNGGTSDALLVCRNSNTTLPLDVPVLKTTRSLLNGDSGFVGEQSFSSGSSDNQSNAPHFLGGSVTMSSGSLYKRWLRSTSTSLERSGSHINSSASADEYFSRNNQRSSKLGLAIIINLSPEEHEGMSHFLMEHAALLESMVWRARQAVEAAYLRSYNFISLMYDMTDCVSRCLLDFFTGPHLTASLWLSLSSGCDKISDNADMDVRKAASWNGLTATIKSDGSKSWGDLKMCEADCEFTFLNIGRLLRNEVRECCDTKRRCSQADKFVGELCELLENVDVKHTNFFISTLLTAVLTHHLGWVATIVSAVDPELSKPYNALWGQLIDLYGAVGHPVKVAHTVITGTNNAELISKILSSLTYFIRCCDIERKNEMRVDVETENSVVNSICSERSCIPKENYKKYEDHLREMDSSKIKEVRKSDLPVHGVFVTHKPRKISVERQRSNIVEEEKVEEKKVVFVLGEDDKLEGIKKDPVDSKCSLKPTPGLSRGLKKETSCFDLKQYMEEETPTETSESTNKVPRPSTLKFSSDDAFENSEFKDEHFVKYCGSADIKPSTSFTTLETNSTAGCSSKNTTKKQAENEFVRSKSVPPEDHKPELSDEMKSRYKYCGFKFNFQQYPQIVTNYMKSKNIELSRLPFVEKDMDFNQMTLNTAAFNFMDSDDSCEEVEALQTPSNASELECVSDLVTERHQVKETVERLPKSFVRTKVPNTLVKDPPKEKQEEMKIISLPMPKSMPCLLTAVPVSYTSSLMRGLSERYLSDMVLQGTSAPKSQWESALRSDLSLAARHPLLDQPIEEAVAIIANIDTWEVQLMSSHTYIVDKGSSGVRVGMSQLVANMLESLLHMWRLHAPAEHCLMHIEQRLQEFLVRSKALAQLLLATEFCTMEFLTSTLQLEVNDVPLLMAVASTHTPQVTEKYGVSFQ